MNAFLTVLKGMLHSIKILSLSVPNETDSVTPVPNHEKHNSFFNQYFSIIMINLVV